MSGWQDEYLRMIEDCEKRESLLTDWERGFLDSLGMRIDKGNAPSPKQVATLDNIWERVTRNG